MKWRATLTVLVMLSASGAYAAGAAADTSPSVDSDRSSRLDIEGAPDVAPLTISTPVSDAELEDLRTIAEQEQISLTDAIDRFSWHDNFTAAVGEIRDAHPNDFAHAAIVRDDLAQVWFRAGSPTSALATLAEFGVYFPSIEVDLVEDYGLTEREIDKAVIAAHFAVYGRDDVSDASTSFDHAARQVVTIVPLGAGDRLPSLVDDARAAVDDVIGDLGSRRVTVRVSESNSLILGGDDSSSRHDGGEALSQCTSGFNARQNSPTSGTRGIITAGHCDNSLSDDSDSLSIVSGTDYDGVNGDWQVHTGPETMRDDFYSGTTSSLELNIRDVSGFAVATVGQTLCRNGKVSYKDCQQVRKNSVCHSGNCYMLQMGEDQSQGGDSGAPVFYSNTVYGIHEGWMYDPSWPADRDTYSRADTFDNATGWHLATSP